MSLAKQIIYGSLKEVNYAIRQHPVLDEIDEYGYTPLIQTTIVNDIEKGRLILEAGADVDFRDLTGRSALHWTTDNANFAFSELLLSYKANPNAYTRASQPVLVMPFLRQQNDIKQLLYKYGGNLDFAHDFINAKLLGHRFELEGRVDIVDPSKTFIEMEFEGFYLEFNLAIVARSLLEFCQNFGGKHLRTYFLKLQTIIEGFHKAAELTRYQHYLVKEEKYDQKINALLDQVTLVIPVACEGHAICFVRYKNLFVRCDRGAYGKQNGTVIIYKMKDPRLLTKSFIKSLLYKRQTQYWIDEGMLDQLKLQRIADLPLPVQLSGNCSWSNVEAVVPAVMFLFLLEEAPEKPLDAIKTQALYIYNEWIKWDKNRALHFCIESFYSTTNSARKASKAALLAAILFQRCDYDNQQDRQKAEKILSILTIPDYLYILKSYVTVFSQDKDNVRFQNLAAFLDEAGLKIEQFKE